MLTAYLVEPDGMTSLDTYATTQEAIDDVRRLWFETEDSETIVIIDDETRATEVTMMRSSRNPEVCLTMYRFDGFQSFLCQRPI